jgi:hypothetical protein
VHAQAAHLDTAGMALDETVARKCPAAKKKNPAVGAPGQTVVVIGVLRFQVCGLAVGHSFLLVMSQLFS